MRDVLRVYDPPECDERGVPLDWDKCRECAVDTPNGRMRTIDCPTCGGHGSLKAAALASLLSRREAACGNVPQGWPPTYVIRCEYCDHPMSEGMWERSIPRDVRWTGDYEKWAISRLKAGVEPFDVPAVHHSPCDERCRHGGPFRCKREEGDSWTFSDTPESLAADRRLIEVHFRVEASWRPVDVRTLGWPHDLRPEKLALLCLRCGAGRKR